MIRWQTRVIAAACGVCFSIAALAADSGNDAPQIRGTFRFAAPAVRSDVSPPLREMAIIPPHEDPNHSYFGGLMIDPDPIDRKLSFDARDADPVVQRDLGPIIRIPSPGITFNVSTEGSQPPDPVGDVGPTHYVRMSNAGFQIFNKTTGASVFGPAATNSLFVGFGGACEVEDAGDPIVLYDQFADRWLLSQFTSAGPAFFNCVAVSMTGDPTGSYRRYAFQTAVFPDYPKYGIWPTATNSAYLITTRELGSNSIGVYAVDRGAILAGSATPVIISFVNELTQVAAPFLGDGLLPADADGSTPPPAGSPAYVIGSMDNGGPYGATQDALSLWRFNINFAAPASSSFVLHGPIPIAPYDTIYPCSTTATRRCIPQPSPLLAIDILSYRQRPLHRAAYRNFGSYESIVTNQSVEAVANMAGVRWWELRNPGGTPELVQDSTFAPGVTDNVHRWMGSIAQDKNGNMGLGYSASGTSVFPSIRYTGRLESDPFGTMPQGEGSIVAATGGSSQSAGRWGDYTSMNVDPTDDCTFWYINQFFATTGTATTLRVGSFKFPECGAPDFGIHVTPLRQDMCTPNDATFQVQAHGYSSFAGTATLSASGNPGTSTVSFSPTTIASVPGTSTMTLGNTGAVTDGTYTINVTGTGGSPSAMRSRSVQVNVFTQTPTAPTLSAPANNAVAQPIRPTFTWSTSTLGQTYLIEVATDAAFTNIVYTSQPSTTTSVTLPASAALNFDTQYFWRARSTNVCGDGANSAVFSFRTRLGPGQCPAGQTFRSVFFDNAENGANGWTVSTGTTWTQSTVSPFSGTTSWLASDVVTVTNQLLTSPNISLPAELGLTQLRFQHEVNMEPNGVACFDGGFIELSASGGAFAALPATSVFQDDYDGALAGGTLAWCGQAPYAPAALDLSSFAGQTVNVRFRMQTDNGVGFAPEGWYVDDIQVGGCVDGFSDGFE